VRGIDVGDLICVWVLKVLIIGTWDLEMDWLYEYKQDHGLLFRSLEGGSLERKLWISCSLLWYSGM
jgi:hypothetical protein